MKGVLPISFGPELVWIWSRDLKKHIGKRVRKLEGGDSWVAVSVSGNAVLLLPLLMTYIQYARLKLWKKYTMKT